MKYKRFCCWCNKTHKGTCKDKDLVRICKKVVKYIKDKGWGK